MKSMALSCNTNNTNSKSDIVAHWLPATAALTIVDPNQPEPLMKLPIFIEQESMQYHTTVLIIDSAETLNFVSQYFLTRIDLWGGVFVVKKSRFALQTSRRLPRLKQFRPPMFRFVRISSLVSALPFYQILNL